MIDDETESLRLGTHEGIYFQHENIKQLLQLCTARTVWSDPVIRPISVLSGTFNTRMVTNEKQRKTEQTNN